MFFLGPVRLFTYHIYQAMRLIPHTHAYSSDVVPVRFAPSSPANPSSPNPSTCVLPVRLAVGSTVGLAVGAVGRYNLIKKKTKKKRFAVRVVVGLAVEILLFCFMLLKFYQRRCSTVP